MTTKATYPIDYAIIRLRQAIDHAEFLGEFRQLRLAINDLEESINAEMDTDIQADEIRKLAYEDREQDELERIAEEKDEHDTIRSIISSFHPF